MNLPTLDPAPVTQPVRLKANGGVRVVFVKFSCSFEASRTDFRRVEPFDEAIEDPCNLPEPLTLISGTADSPTGHEPGHLRSFRFYLVSC